MAPPLVVALEIGTSKVVALIGELREDGHVMIIGKGEHPSTGIRKGETADLENAAVCVRAAIHAAEEAAKADARQIHLAVSGGHIQSHVTHGTAPVRDRAGEISRDDVDEVLELARAINLPPDRSVIHSLCQYFHIDDQDGIVNPEGMEGARLSVDMLVVHGVRSRLNNTIRVVDEIPLTVTDTVFSGLCSALAVLSAEQRQNGALVIDCGGGTTDYLLYTDNVVAAAGAFGVGGDHVTNDLALAFNIPAQRAERLKCESGSAAIDALDWDQKVVLPAEVGFEGRTISLKSVQTVIHARMEETFQMVHHQLEQEEALHRIGAGVVLTGGGAHLKGLTGLAEKVFGLPCTVGKPRHVSGLVAAVQKPEYATCCGLVHYAFQTMVPPGRGSFFKNLVKGIFGG